MNIFLWGFVCALLWLLMQVFCVTSFHIPSDSMEPGLQAGDVVLVNKWTYGARLFNILDAVEGSQVDIHRMPGVGKIQRNDIIVFNNPCPKHWMKIEMDVMQYYVKRCIALPGDVFHIDDGHYKVSGYKGELGEVNSQKRFKRMILEQDLLYDHPVVRAYPGDSILGWTAVKFGPFYIPRAQDSIPMNIHTFKLYRNVIEWERESKVSYRNGKVYVGDKPIDGYRFLNNYYFVAGDKVENSRDSRYWGLLPESFIVGKAWRIWKSVDRSDENIRWERVWKKVE